MALGLVAILALGVLLASVILLTRQESWSYPEAVAGALFLAYNQARFGDPLDFGYATMNVSPDLVPGIDREVVELMHRTHIRLPCNS